MHAQLESVIELASSQEQPTLAEWLSGVLDEVDPVLVLREYEAGALRLLNGAQLARLARALCECGELGAAMRVYDYAVLVTPSDRHLHAEREELAGSISNELDLEEQIELAEIVGSSRERSNAVVLIASLPTVDSDPDDLASLRVRVDRIEQAGFDLHIFLVPDPNQPLAESGAATGFGTEAMVEVLRLPALGNAGVDATIRELARELATRVAEIAPVVLFTDGTLVAQRLAATVGRALATLVDFSLESDAMVDAATTSTSRDRLA